MTSEHVAQLRPAVQVPDPVLRYASTLERTPEPSEAPWAPLTKPLNQCRFSLVTTGGVRPKTSEPFDITNDGYDWSHREIPLDAKARTLMVTHNHYDHAHVDSDINAMLPIDRFRELTKEGVIAGMSKRGFGLYGYIRDPEALARETAPKIAEALKEDGADAVFLTPG